MERKSKIEVIHFAVLQEKNHSIVKQLYSNKNEGKKWATDAYDTPDKPYSNYEKEIKQKKE